MSMSKMAGCRSSYGSFRRDDCAFKRISSPFPFTHWLHNVDMEGALAVVSRLRKTQEEDEHMKKIMMIAAAVAFVAGGFTATDAFAGTPKALKSCKGCHGGNPGPKFVDIKAAYTAKYGANASAKLTAFLSDVATNGKKGTVAPSVDKYAGKVKTMRGQGKKVKKAGADKAAAAIMGM